MGAAEPSATEAAGRSSLFVCARGAAPQPGPSLQVSGARGILQQRVLRGERRQRGAVGAGAARAGRGRRSRAAVRSRRRGRRTAGWGWRPSGAGGGPCRRAAPPFLASAPPPRRPRPRAGRPGGAGLCSAPAPPPAPQLRDRPGAPLPSRLPPRSHRTCRYPNCPSRRRRFTQYAVPAAAAPASATHSAATAPAAAPAARVPPPTCGEAERHGGRGGARGSNAPLRSAPPPLACSSCAAGGGSRSGSARAWMTPLAAAMSHSTTAESSIPVVSCGGRTERQRSPRVPDPRRGRKGGR